MNGALFTLVDTDNRNRVFAWGMEIVESQWDTNAEDRVAVIYRRDLDGGRATHGTHGSAEAARAFYSRLLPIDLDLVWQEPPGW